MNRDKTYLTYDTTTAPADLNLFDPAPAQRLTVEVIEQLREDFGDRFVRRLMLDRVQ